MENVWETLSIGSDESGKGDFFGAPSVAAVRLDGETLRKLKEQSYYWQIRDSKKCTNEFIKEIAPRIMELCQCHCISIMPEEYNRLHREHGNVNVIMAMLHNSVHLEVKGEEPRIVDAFAAAELYYGYLDRLKTQKVRIDNFCQKADSAYLSVSLASIVARYHYILQMEELTRMSGVSIPYGNSYKSPNSVIGAYKSLLRAGYGKEEINNTFVKSHFSTLTKIQKYI